MTEQRKYTPQETIQVNEDSPKTQRKSLYIMNSPRSARKLMLAKSRLGEKITVSFWKPRSGESSPQCSPEIQENWEVNQNQQHNSDKCPENYEKNESYGRSPELQSPKINREKIYTDWANHYLEKARCKRRVSRLSTDCSDGVLLADVIESVINMKIPDINRKPKTSDQMLDNINSCLSILRSQRVAGVDSVATQDLRDGRLKAVLALFFALSRHKQALKQRASAQQPNCNTATGGSHASLAGTHTASSNAGTIDHRTMAPQLTDTHAVPPIRQIATSGGVVGLKGGTSIPLPGSKTRPPAAAPSVGGGSSRASSPGGSLIPTRGSGVPAPQTKSSLKLYPPATTNVPSGKRTSSSSGVSSARSDSSASLDNRKCANKSLTRPNNVPQQKPQIVQASKTGQVINKKEIETEKKITNAKLPEPKIKSSNSSNKILSTNDKMIPPKQSGLLQSTGIPKPTAAVKGTSKNVKDDTKSVPILKNNITRENSSVSLTCVKPAVPVVALVSPIMSESVQQNQENENHEEEVCVPMKAMYDLHHTNGGYASDGDILQQRKGFNAVQDGYMSDAYQNCRTGTRVPDVLSDPSRPRRGGPAEDASAPPPPLGPRPANGVAQHNGGAQVVAVRQQRHRLVDPTSQSAQWKKYTDSPGVGSPITTSGTTNTSSPSPTPTANNHRERKDSPHRQSKDKNSSSSKVKVPQSFGYVKRNSVGLNGTSMAIVSGSNAVGQATNSKTAQVSAVPRTKVKVSGGTQTCSSDLQPSHKSNTQYKSYSLTGNTASQLSQSVRERLLMGSQSLPKAVIGSGHDYPRQPRAKASDGSLSDTQATDSMSQYAPWLRHSNTYSVAPRLTETDSLESLSSLPGHRSSLTHSRMIRDPAARISRSNSIRSTKSEKLYPSMLHRGIEIEHEPYYCLPVGAQQHWSQPTSPAPRLYPMSPTHSAPRHANDDIHGSTVSLVSTTSSLYSSAEEKQAHEIRKLRRELIDAQEKVHTLTSQLTTNAHVVSAFEQSLSSMTQRLQHLTATSERKESELQELRTAMDNLRAQSVQAGLTSGLARQPSSDSVSSMSSACSLDKQDKKKKKGWLRSSFTKAFSRNAKQTKVQSLSEGETSEQSSHHHHTDPKPSQIIMAEQNPEVEELQKQLREKDLVLTDIRLEALSSAHQLESLKDTVMKMRNEMLSLKQNNERLQRMVGGSIPIDDNEMDCINEPPPDVIAVDDGSVEQETDGKRITISVYLGQPHTFERYYDEHYTCDGSQSGPEGNEISIAYKNIGASMSWGQLDGIVRRAFKQHMARVDPGSCLGLGGDSIARYRLGEAERSPDAQPPDLLPVGYVIGGVNVLHVILQPVCALAFDALIPRSVAQRLVSLLSEHKRLVLCGPPGTGKTFLAQKLATFHALTQGRDPAEAVATFNVDHKSGKELRQYLAHLGERATAECDGDDSRQSDCDVLPSVVVLDDLHRAGPLNEALGSLPRSLPCLVGTMAQAACSATSLQLQHGFRWVLVAPHIEPASGLLGRVLRRRLACLELSQGDRPELAAVLGWLPRVWKHLNKFLETHSSSDVAIGPRFFLACPLDINAAKAWFSDVWNYSLAPYLREAAREGLQLYGKRAAWVDPCQFILDTYPWPGNLPQNLTRIEPQDVGLENNSNAQSESESDPLLNMLMRLQEAANYSSTHSNDSDCASLDSNFTHESSVGSESVL